MGERELWGRLGHYCRRQYDGGLTHCRRILRQGGYGNYFEYCHDDYMRRHKLQKYVLK